LRAFLGPAAAADSLLVVEGLVGAASAVAG